LRAVLESRIHEYTERVEYLLQQLDKTLNPPSDVPEAPFFDPTSSSEDESALQRKEYEDHHPHRVSQMAGPNLPAFEAVTKPNSAHLRSGSPPTSSNIENQFKNDDEDGEVHEDGEEWVYGPIFHSCLLNPTAHFLLYRYIPEVIPDAPNFASVGFSKFHNSFGPSPGAAPADDDDVFKLSQHMRSLNAARSQMPSSQGSMSSQGSSMSSSAVPSGPSFQQPTQQMINGRVYNFGGNPASPYGTGSSAMAQYALWRSCFLRE
jgi:hypothetical protein